MSLVRRLVCVSLLFVLASVSAVQAVQVSDDLLIPVEKRSAAPKLSLRDLEGKKRQLADFGGKIVLVNFWATWCGPCRQEMPAFSHVYAEYRDRGIEMVGAANEERASRAKVGTFVRGLGLEFSIWLEASAEHMEAFGVGPELPATVIVDTKGRLAARIHGVTDETQLRVLIDRILNDAGR